MVLQSDFKIDGADHARLFDFEVELEKKGDTDKDQQRLLALRQREARFKTVVCRHWVMDLCMKMDECEYLHELNPARMPECRWGEKCQVPDCIFKHTKEEDRIECTFYKIGFCRKGPSCRFRHVRRAPEEIPEVIDWDDIGDARGMVTVTEVTHIEDGVERKTFVQHNENYKVSICKHWQKTGTCPFADRCHFAHGDHELRQRGGGTGPEEGAANGDTRKPTGPPETTLVSIIKGFQESSDADPNPLADTGRGIRTPDDGVLRPAYFVVRTSLDPTVFLASLRYKCWSVLPCFMERLNQAYKKSSSVFIFFASCANQEFAGCAMMKSAVQEAQNVPFVNLPPEARNTAFLFDVEWMYMTSLKFQKTAYIMTWEDEVFMDIPVAMSFECAELSPTAGRALMVMMCREPQLHVQVPDSDAFKLTVNMEGPDRDLAGPVDEHINAMVEYIKANPGYLSTTRSAHLSGQGQRVQLVGPEGVPVGLGSVLVPNLPGFVIGCRLRRFCQEMVNKSLLGAPASRVDEMSEIQRGTFVVVLNLEDNKLIGVFEALGPAEEHIDPFAFRTNEEEHESTSDLPIQVRVRRILEAAPILARQVPNTVLATDQGEADCFRSIPAPEMQNLANLFARLNNKSGAGGGTSGGQSGGYGGGSGGLITEAADYPPGISVHPLSSRPGSFARKVVANVPFKHEFKPANRIIGRGGGNIRRVQEVGVRCTVKAVDEDLPQNDIEGPIQIKFFSQDEEAMNVAEGLIIEMFEDLISRYNDFLDGAARRGGGGPRNNHDDDFHGNRGGRGRGGRGDRGGDRGGYDDRERDPYRGRDNRGPRDRGGGHDDDRRRGPPPRDRDRSRGDRGRSDRDRDRGRDRDRDRDRDRGRNHDRDYSHDGRRERSRSRSRSPGRRR